MKKQSILIAISALIIGMLLGWLIFGGSDEKHSDQQEDHVETSAKAETIWTCSMHPQIRQSEPGDCPICGMDLIPLEADQGELDPMAVSMSSTAMQLARVETMTAGNSKAEKNIRLNGKIQADERRVHTQSSHVPGRIERLMVNFTGDYVRQGQVIAYLYSPELVTAQQELFEAAKIKDAQPALFHSAREKLKNWKLSDTQIAHLLASGKPLEQFPVLANTSGYVTKKMVNPGDYVARGEAIYQVADLSKVWVLFDVYESEMGLIRKGSAVSYTVSSLPGKTFKGVISYVDPVIDPATRVAKARIEVPNGNLLLKPEMFVSGTVQSAVSSGKQTITLPKSAVMWTGKRSVVYVMQTTEQGVSFAMREVTLGPELGESYVIESGIEPGEEVAVHGTFAIDAAAQLAGKPSMMSPRTDAGSRKKIVAEKVVIPAEAKKALAPLFDAYFRTVNALASDDFAKAKASGKLLKTESNQVNMNLFKGKAHDVWMKASSELKNAVQHLEHAADIAKFRGQFVAVSEIMVAMAESFGPLGQPMYVQHCPMADSDKGANWLSTDKAVKNPYFGKAMLTCGETRKTIGK